VKTTLAAADEAAMMLDAALRLAESAGRASRSMHRPELIGDAEGHEHLRLRPLGAQTPAELVAVLRELRMYAGDPPYRVMAARASQRVAHSTMC
jgi:hypothetical protein